MPVIDPFGFSPLGSFNSLHAYMMCTWMRVLYMSREGDPDFDPQIAAIMGATNFQVIPHLDENGFIYPRTDVATLSNGKKVVMIRGTSILPDELIAEIGLSGLVTQSPWLGRVSQYFSIVAGRTFTRIPFLGTSWMIAGHSLGGAIASMVGVHGAEKYFTAGQPREGDGTYAASRPTPFKLRLTNQNDPVPHVPHTTATEWDYLDLDIPLFLLSQNYRHWGIRHHLWSDGTLTLPPQIDPNELQDQNESLNDLINGNAIVTHLAPEYCRRLRLRIPLAFPAIKSDPDFPMIVELDSLNFDLNIYEELDPWEIDGRGGSGIPVERRQPVPPRQLPNTDPYQFLCG